MTSIQSIFVFAPGILAGAERVVLTGINALYDLGVSIKIIVIQETRAPNLAEDFALLLNPKIPIQIVITSRPLDFSLRRNILNILELEKSHSLIHTHGFKALFYCYLTFSKHQIIHTHHGNTGHTMSVRVYEYLTFKIMKRCKHIIAVSHKMKNELLLQLRPYKKITTIENMLSLKNAEEIRIKRNLLQRDQTKIELIYIGRISPEKGLLPFIEYFKNFQNKDQFHLNILGDGPDFYKIENYIKMNSLHKLITLNGFVTEQTQFLVLADLLILPSFKEGLPMTLIEAASVGLSVLANNVGAISTLVNNDINGLLIDDFNETNWHNALNSAIKNQNLWAKNAMNDAENIESKYSAKSWAKKTFELYKAQ